MGGVGLGVPDVFFSAPIVTGTLRTIGEEDPVPESTATSPGFTDGIPGGVDQTVETSQLVATDTVLKVKIVSAAWTEDRHTTAKPKPKRGRRKGFMGLGFDPEYGFRESEYGFGE